MKYDFESGSLWGLADNGLASGNLLGGLSVSEDKKGICLEALAPNINPKSIEVSFKKGFLTIKADKRR